MTSIVVAGTTCTLFKGKTKESEKDVGARCEPTPPGKGKGWGLMGQMEHDVQSHRHARHTHRQIDRQTDGQTDRRRYRYRNIQRQRNTERYRDAPIDIEKY